MKITHNSSFYQIFNKTSSTRKRNVYKRIGYLIERMQEIKTVYLENENKTDGK
jgi:hypothetical protein